MGDQNYGTGFYSGRTIYGDPVSPAVPVHATAVTHQVIDPAVMDDWLASHVHVSRGMFDNELRVIIDAAHFSMNAEDGERFARHILERLEKASGGKP